MEELKLIQKVLADEASAIISASERLDQLKIKQLLNIYKMLTQTGGQLIFTGIGKSGLVAQKLASTFSSLGLASFFLHPVEALHGDLGRVGVSDIVVLISKSGNTEELIRLIPYLPIEKNNRIGLLGKVISPLGEACGLNFDCSIEREACLNDLAPTTSTTVTMAVGDGMAVLYENYINLSKEKFAVNHPAGMLGKILRLKVKDVMIKANDCPIVKTDDSIKEVILKMTNRPLGICVIIDENSKIGLKGIIVEGDIRRALTTDKGLDEILVRDMMNKDPVVTSPETLAYDALKIMESAQKQISTMPVVDNGKFLGIVRLHDLIQNGLSTSK